MNLTNNETICWICESSSILTRPARQILGEYIRFYCGSLPVTILFNCDDIIRWIKAGENRKVTRTVELEKYKDKVSRFWNKETVKHCARAVITRSVSKHTFRVCPARHQSTFSRHLKQLRGLFSWLCDQHKHTVATYSAALVGSYLENNRFSCAWQVCETPNCVIVAVRMVQWTVVWYSRPLSAA